MESSLARNGLNYSIHTQLPPIHLQSDDSLLHRSQCLHLTLLRPRCLRVNSDHSPATCPDRQANNTNKQLKLCLKGQRNRSQTASWESDTRHYCPRLWP